MFTKLFHAGAAALLTLGLAACGDEAQEPVETAPDAPAGVTVSEGRMNLPAVAGNPAAVYFTLSNEGDRTVTIRSAHVAGAESTALHQTAEWSLEVDMQEIEQFPVAPGENLVLEPGGNHVMAMNVDETLQPGGETEVTLTFAGGDKISFPVRLLAPGEEAGDEGMEMGE